MRQLTSKLFIALSLAVFLKAHIASAHSWEVCNDYPDVPTATSTNTNFDATKCKGWARNYAQAAAIVPNNLFSGDSGFPVQPGTAGAPCKTVRTPGAQLSSYYSDRFPMANYTIGQKYMVMWPSKNHGAGANIPDTEMKLYAVCDTSADPANVAAFKTNANLVIDWKANGGTGFKNCPGFAASGDGAQCYQFFNVTESFFTPYIGNECTFIWYWAFNSAADIYTTCFDAYISPAAIDTGAGGAGGAGGQNGGSKNGAAAGGATTKGSQAGVAIGVTLCLAAAVGGLGFIAYKKKPEWFGKGQPTAQTNKGTAPTDGPYSQM